MAPFHADWRCNGDTINYDTEQGRNETSTQFRRRIIEELTAKLNQFPPDNT